MQKVNIEKCNCGKIKVGEYWVSPLDFIRKIIELRNEKKIENVELVDCMCGECIKRMKKAKRIGGHLDAYV